MEEKVLNIIEDLMQQLYRAKGFDICSYNSLERNIFEAEMTKKYQEVQSELEDVVSTHEYLNDLSLLKERNEELEKDIEDLEERLAMAENDVTDLINRNYELNEEKEKYWNRIQEISKVVNDTWS